ncbi:MAG: hypothetical protein ACFFCD_13610 [Promethearchaeota archaeon]
MGANVEHEIYLSSALHSNESCPKLLKIGNKLFCQRTFLWVDDYRQEVCYNCYEYDYCVLGVDYLNQLVQFGVRSLEDILLLNKKQFCEPRSIDESLVAKWRDMIAHLTPFERDYLQKLLKRMVKTLL